MAADGTGVEEYAYEDYAERRRYCTAVAEALVDAGVPPGERRDESGGTALYWTEGPCPGARAVDVARKRPLIWT